jgi:hypothetical protein
MKCTQCLMGYTLSDKILIMESLLYSYQAKLPSFFLNVTF